MLDLRYDWRGRSISKKATYGLGRDSPSTLTSFIYDGWNIVATMTRKHEQDKVKIVTLDWGLDLSRSAQGAGGVGGLLATRTSEFASSRYTTNSRRIGQHFPSYDANGNIIAWTSEGGEHRTTRDFDAFGNIVTNQGERWNESTPFGFSTKYEDVETGLLYYGYRYYDPVTGRWPSRDPIEERGGINLYGMVGNDAMGRWDYLGLNPKPGDRMRPNEFERLPEESKDDWANDFKKRFGHLIASAAKRHCVPKKLLAGIIANEMMDWQFPDGTFMDGIGGGGVGPAQISVNTAINTKNSKNVSGIDHDPSIPFPDLAQKAKVERKLKTDTGAVDVAAKLLRKYLQEICEKKDNGNFGNGFKNRFRPQNCDLTVICCLPCHKVIEAEVPDCLLQMATAKWNSPNVVNANDPIGDNNFPNAHNHSGWASINVGPILDQLVD